MTTSDLPARGDRRHRRRVRLTRTLVVLVALGLVATAVTYGVAALHHPRPVADSCQVIGETTGTIYAMAPDQLLNASIIADVAMRRGLPQQAVIVALATAMQESKLENIDYGDRDSVGLFQQRPSQGWGPEADLIQPVYASGKFFDALVKVPNWQELTVAVAAQDVQRSGFPDAYTGWEPRATALAAALTGTTSNQLTCRLGRPGVSAAASLNSPSVSSAASSDSAGPLSPSAAAVSSAPTGAKPVSTAVTTLVASLATDLGINAPTVIDGKKSATITVTGLIAAGTGDDAAAAHRSATVSAWALAHATVGITQIVLGDQLWRPDRDGWQPAPNPASGDAVVITIANR